MIEDMCSYIVGLESNLMEMALLVSVVVVVPTIDVKTVPATVSAAVAIDDVSAARNHCAGFLSLRTMTSPPHLYRAYHSC